MNLKKLLIGFSFMILSPTVYANNQNSALSEEDLNFDFRKRGFNVNMDSRIAVDGKRICFYYADKSKKNRCEAITDCQTRALKDLNKRISALSNESQRDEKYQMMIHKGQILAFKEATLIESAQAFEEAYNFAKTFNKEKSLEALAMLGVVYLRLGEVTNCIKNHNGDSCLFPLTKFAQHIDKTGSKKSLKIFYEYLSEKPDDDHIKWLVNILHMTLGSYPKGVPKNYLIPLNKIQPELDLPKFINIATELGLNEQANFGGVAVADFNGDGYPDIIFGSLNQCEPIKYYQFNPTSKKFENKTIEAGLGNQKGAGLILVADYDNDGDFDFYLTRGAWHPGGREYPTQGGFAYNSLLRNNGDGTFTDVTETMGLKTHPNSTLSANWGDINNDGWLDLIVSNESSETEVFINKKTKFENYTKKSGLINQAIGKGTILADLNNNGNLDLVISNYAAPNRIFWGNGKGYFALSKKQPLLKYPDYGFPVVVFDYNNDGFQDIFMAAFAPDIDNFAKWLQGKPHKGEEQKLYLNNKDGTFSDVTSNMKLDRLSITMSANFGDLQSNGFKDLYLGTGANSLGDLEPNRLFINREGHTFLDATFSAHVGSLQKGHGIAFADLNGDGYPELILQQGGSSQGDRYFPAVFLNPGFKENAFIEIELEGAKSNRKGLHSKIEVVINEGNGNKRSIFSWAGASGSFGTNPPTTLVGLGKANALDSIKVTWQGSGLVQTVNGLGLNRKYKIREGQTKPIELEMKAVDFTSKTSDKAKKHTHHEH